MNDTLNNSQIERLMKEKNIWIATVRKNSHPHLVPIWFVWVSERFFICIGKNSVKAQNILQNPRVCLSLEDGSNVLICEGTAEEILMPWPNTVWEAFNSKYDWDIIADRDYDLLLCINPRKWLSW